MLYAYQFLHLRTESSAPAYTCMQHEQCFEILSALPRGMFDHKQNCVTILFTGIIKQPQIYHGLLNSVYTGKN